MPSERTSVRTALGSAATPGSSQDDANESRRRRRRWGLSLIAVVVAAAWCAIQSNAGAQQPRSRVKNVRALDQRAERASNSYLNELAKLANEYESAGELEKAKSMLKLLLKVNPDLTAARDRIKQIEESELTSNEQKLELDVSKRWGLAAGRVRKGDALRIEAKGTYRFVTNTTVSPEGFPRGDPVKDMAGNVPCGMLMGLIVSDGKPGKPFPIGSRAEFKPPNDGVLFLSVNIPPGHKCTGRLTIRVTGNVQKYE